MKITANIATYAPRKESLKKMLQSIDGQFDEIRIYDNERRPERADNGKFYFLDDLTEPEIYCTLDDDLIYPPSYVDTIKHNLDKYGCVITFHGRQLLGEGHNYYKGHRDFRCLDKVEHDEMVDVPGTGVMAFSTEYFHPKGLADAKDLRMADLVFGLEAAKQGIQIGVIHHERGWIKHIPNKETIYETETRNGIKRQNELADEIFRLRNKGE